MLLHRNPRPVPVREHDHVHGVLRTHWVLGICVVCSHELPCGENHRTSCPGCGAQLRFFPMYRDLESAA
jgi:hypothetical protein